MKKIAFGILMICALSSCNQNTTTFRSHKQNRTITIPICPAEQQIVLRATDENTISDVNVYLVQEQDVLLHKYTCSEVVQFSYPAGQYQLYVIANHHADMGDLDFEELRSYTLYRLEDYSDLPMTAVTDIVITASNDIQVLPPVVVRRSVAKINYNVHVASLAQDIALKSVQVMSLPAAYGPFDSLAPNSSSTYENSAIIENEDRVSKMSGSFYMLPNLQGTVPQIITPQQKNTQTAPAHASYLRIRAMRDNKLLDYTVYMGENDTSDFNIRSNTAHTMNITILNDNEADVRIKSYTIDVDCKMQAEPENGIYLLTAPIILTANLSGDTNEARLYCEVKVKAGDLSVLNINGASAPVVRLPLYDMNGLNTFKITYKPSSITSKNYFLSFTVNIYDRYGFVKAYDFNYRFADKIVKVYTKWFEGGNGSGSLSSPDAVKWVEQASLSSVYYLFYCTEQGCTIVPQPINLFIGFYRSHDSHDYLGSEEYFHYNPISTNDTIYAFFKY